MAIIALVYKAGAKNDICNYRSILLISAVSKIFETVMKKKFLLFMEKYQIINKRQYGFMPHRSLEDAVFDHIRAFAIGREAEN